MADVRTRSPWAITGTVLKYGLLTLGAIIMLAPFADMFLGALRTPAERLAQPPAYWPSDPQWGNYLRVFTELPMGRWIFNSVAQTCIITVLQLLTSAMAGFALAKYHFPGRDLLFRAVLGAQMFPFFLFLIPVFFILRYFPLFGGNDILGQGGTGFLNSYAAIILPFSVTWYGIFLMRQFFISLPDALIEAARLDGASEFRIFFEIALPLSAPGLATLGIFVFIYQWNEVIWTMTVTRTAPALQTIPVGIYLLRGAFIDQSTLSLQQAALAVSIVPVIVTFLLLQRFYIRGLTAGAIKG